MEIIIAEQASHFEAARQLFVEYQEFLGVDLCFQGFHEELETLDTMYAPPAGTLLLAKHNNQYAGCVAVRRKSEGVCEMKRLYVKDDFKKMGTGRQLAARIIETARQLGYSTMVLDTLDRLKPALALYRSLGFYETSAYYANPLQGVIYLALDL